MASSPRNLWNDAPGRRWLRLSLIVFFLLLVFGPAFQIALPLVDQNLVMLNFIRAVTAESIQAVERQTTLARYADFLDDTREAGVAEQGNRGTDASMLHAYFVGEYHRRQGENDEAAAWYRTAAHAAPQPNKQSSLAYAQRSRLLADGSLLVHNFSDLVGWQQIPETNVQDVMINSQNGALTFSYANRNDQRDIFAYQLFPEGGIPLGYHSILSLRALTEPGSYLTLETKVDGKYERHINYYQGSGEWETISVPLAGERLEAIFLSMGEPGKPPTTTPVYTIHLDWIHLDLRSDPK
jgi:hypothetical protein